MSKYQGEKYPILADFDDGHLPLLNELACQMAALETDRPAEVAAGLRKLLEAKDCFRRAALK